MAVPAALPLVVMGIVLVVDAATGAHYNLLPVYAAGPAIAAARGPVRLVPAMGIVAMTICVAVAASSGRLGYARMYVALIAILYVTLAASYAAWVRVRAERRLVDVQEVANALEDGLFVPVPSTIGPVRLAASYVSASRATRVGGDLYKAVACSRGVRVVIADVQGKGLGTVRCAAVVLAAFREAAPDAVELTEVARRIETALDRSTDGERFVTGLLAQVSDAGHLVVLNQGHPAPLLVTTDGRAELIEPMVSIPPFGLTALAGADPQQEGVTRSTLHPGDRILFYTDGLSEARDGTGRFYPVAERAGSLLTEGCLETALRRLRADVAAFTGSAPNDDSALLLLEFGPGNPAGVTPGAR
ncbi:serine/threonine-protein phosphatase [Streptomyces sp. P01-B04]|uniref:PP2C family protein-serine/threonine phosphatase n=1 Tax=Streptomyces poriferorum TaxID=2798799 RepID=UPI001C5D2B3A|nr:PP2C family protein-serine/threonine phosphatase [Streptomyces poriferorum]MBW5250483.1 serine/threonine-protein phosphatase [Streptomyces poriferorum]MBW5259543.1 serine/threonine-protein phosphatase [Streptomyces poriferorum]